MGFFVAAGVSPAVEGGILAPELQPGFRRTRPGFTARAGLCSSAGRDARRYGKMPMRCRPAQPPKRRAWPARPFSALRCQRTSRCYPDTVGGSGRAGAMFRPDTRSPPPGGWPQASVTIVHFLIHATPNRAILAFVISDKLRFCMALCAGRGTRTDFGGIYRMNIMGCGSNCHRSFVPDRMAEWPGAPRCFKRRRPDYLIAKAGRPGGC